jgi:hypothetical protein
VVLSLRAVGCASLVNTFSYGTYRIDDLTKIINSNGTYSWVGIKKGEYPQKEFAMKKAVLTVLAAGFLAMLAGCVSYDSYIDSLMDGMTTALLPDGTIQWARWANTKQSQEKILQVAWSSKEELEQLGKKDLSESRLKECDPIAWPV